MPALLPCRGLLMGSKGRLLDIDILVINTVERGKLTAAGEGLLLVFERTLSTEPTGPMVVLVSS